MIKSLQAQGPSAALGDQAKVFGRFVGTWDVDYGSLGKDGKWSHMAGQMIEGWVMDGHALQDLFIVNAGVMGPERQMGTTLRYFDAKVHKWHVIYVEPPTNSVVQMLGGMEGDRIVLYGKGRDSSLLRWSFNDITESSFTWRGERSRDAGKTWRLEEEYRMTRRTKERTMGTTLRFFDAKSGTWHVIYIEPPSNSVVDLTGGAEGDRIVLYAKNPDGASMRWSFNDITDSSFVWRDEMSRDGGKTWRLTEEHHLKRHAVRS